MPKLIRFTIPLILWTAAVSCIVPFDGAVCDSLIVGRWIGFGAVMLTGIVLTALMALFSDGQSPLLSATALSWPLAAAGLTIAVHCMLQAAGIVGAPAGSAFKVVATFDNPAGVAAALAVTWPFCAYLTIGHRRSLLFQCVTFAVCALVLAVIGSRAGLMSLGACFATFMLLSSKIRKPAVTVTVLLVLACIAAFVIWMSLHKTGSNSGRILILDVCNSMFRDAPLTGHGFHGFRREYMLYQAELLKRPDMKTVSMLADNVTHPLNGYALAAVNFGVSGIILLVVAMALFVSYAIRHRSMESIAAVSVLAGTGVMALFSYPMRYPLTTLALVAAICIMFGNWVSSIPDTSRTLLCITACVTGAAGLAVFIPWAVNQHRWGQAAREFELNGCTVELLEKYDRLYLSLEHDPYFLYNYAYVLSQSGDSRKAAMAARDSFEQMANYDTALLLADTEKECGEHTLAESHYRLASDMCPVRFMPLYSLFMLYEEQGRKDEMNEIGKLILSKPIKVQSDTVRRIRLSVRQRMMVD